MLSVERVLLGKQYLLQVVGLVIETKLYNELSVFSDIGISYKETCLMNQQFPFSALSYFRK